jgi:hypothetical protein
MRLRRIFGIFLIALIYLVGLLPLLFGHPEMGFPNVLVAALVPLALSPYYLIVFAAGIYFLISRKHRIIDLALIVTVAILFLPITPGYAVFVTPGFMLWGDVSSPFRPPETPPPAYPPSVHPPGNETSPPTYPPGNWTEGIQYLEGNATLKVIMLAPDDTPVQGLEVDLWTADAPPGPPNAAIKYTDKDGSVTFKVPPGSYRIGFNMRTFPEGLIYPGDVEVEVTEEEAAEKIIKLQPK